MVVVVGRTCLFEIKYEILQHEEPGFLSYAQHVLNLRNWRDENGWVLYFCAMHIHSCVSCVCVRISCDALLKINENFLYRYVLGGNHLL